MQGLLQIFTWNITLLSLAMILKSFTSEKGNSDQDMNNIRACEMSQRLISLLGDDRSNKIKPEGANTNDS